jgi:hypothetical protein
MRSYVEVAQIGSRLLDHRWLPLLLGLLLGALVPSPAQVSGPLTVSGNTHYFKDARGAALILNGSQTWNTFQDWGTEGSVQTLDFDAFVKFLTAHGHKLTLLWTVEMPKFCGLPTTANSPPEFAVSPLPYKRTGPETATDGGLKFDLTKFDPSFFDRLRTRTRALGDSGIYAGVYLFTGEFLNSFRCSRDGYPFSGANNINGFDDGYAGGSKGIRSCHYDRAQCHHPRPGRLCGEDDQHLE